MGAGHRRRLRAVVIGAGYVARHHLAALRDLEFVDIVALVDLHLSAARFLASEFRVETVAATLAEIAGQSPDVAFVLTPPEFHCELTLQALQLGCDVFVEKPMAETTRECDAMIRAASERGRVLSVNHSDRFDPAVARALDLVRSGACGEPVVLDILRSSEYAPYGGGPLPAMVRQGSYPFRDLGTHGLYLIEAFLGPITSLEVTHRASGRDPNLRFDEWYATAACERGIGRLQISWNVRPMQSRLILQGTRGIVEVDRFLQTCRISRTLPGPKFVGAVWVGFLNAVKQAVQIPVNVLRFATGRLRPSPGIRIGATAFMHALHERRSPPVAASEGRRIVAMLEAACREADAERTAELASRLLPIARVPILVTGAAGFLGGALVRRLRESGSEVRVLVRRPTPWMLRDPGIQVVIGDLGDPQLVSHAVEGVDVVYHVGAAMRGGPREFSAGTVWGTRNVVASCVNWQVRSLVYVSSLMVLDHAGRDPELRITESSPLEPHPEKRGLYTQSKVEAEQIVGAAMAADGLRAVIIRPGQIFGPGSENVPPNGVVTIAGRWIAVGPGRQTIPLVYIDDTVDALILAGTSDQVVGRCFNVVDPRESRQDEYLAAVGRHAGNVPTVLRIPSWIFVGLALGVEMLGRVLGRSVPLTRYRARSLRPLANFNLDAARRDLGWEPRVGVVAG
ncbi:MAG: NAD-dependent epimerase/dehydratase family protein, partial [Burkholderiales bacterium]